MRRTSSRPVKTATVVGLTLAAIGLAASPALAATVTTTPGTVIVEGGAENDVITVTSPGAGSFVVDSAAGITSGSPACVAQSATRATCTGPSLSLLLIRGNEGDDTITNDTAAPSNLQGMVGDDTLIGGSGDDSLNGGTGLDTVDGRGGNDQFFMKGVLVDRITCGEGNDVATVDDSDVIAADCEQLIGRTATPPPPAPGAPNEPGQEPVQVFPEPAAGACESAQKLDGTSRRDRLTGTPLGDVLIGLEGNDRLLGLGGADCLFGNEGNDRLLGGLGPDFLKGETGNDALSGGRGPDGIAGDQGRDIMVGGPSNDVVAAGSGNDRAAGGSGDDTIGGGRGNDRVRGDAGVDRLFGGTGRDAVNAVDGTADVVDCGPGRDRARADRIDQVTNCESVTRVASF